MRGNASYHRSVHMPGTGVQAVPNPTSRLYGYLQTTALIAFAAIVFLFPGPLIITQNKSATIAGDVLCAFGILLLFTAFRDIGHSIQIAPEPRADAKLVTTGVYRWFRHPIYTAILLVVIGIFLRTPALFIAIAGGIVALFLVIKVRFEERLLTARYPAYPAYKATSWGLVPWPRRRS